MIMKKIVLLILLIFGIIVVNAQQYSTSSSRVDFKIKNAGFNVNGAFDSLYIKLDLKKERWDKASLSGKVYAASIKTGIGIRDKHLKNEDYFEVDKYPWIEMKSLALKKTKNGELQGQFLLTIKNISKEVMVPFSYVKRNDKITMNGQFNINRLEFNLGETSLVLSDDVNIEIAVEFYEEKS